MSNRLCLFEKKLKDKRYRETEKKILRLYLEGENLSVEDVAKRVGISRATFYRHHETIGVMAKDYEGLISAWLERKFKGARKITARRFYREALFFVLQNREIFDFLAVRGRNPFLLLVKYGESVVAREKQLLEDEMIYQIYAAEIVAVLEMWRKSELDDGMVEAVLGNILYLTETAGIRLSPLKSQSNQELSKISRA